jgi:hypothetical protein
MPITWRNVAGRGNADAARFLEGAGESINRGIDSVREILDTAVAKQARGRELLTESNNNTYRDALAKYTTEEGLNQAVEEGVFTELAGSFDPRRVDRDLLRTGVEERRKELRSALTANQEFEDTQLTRDLSPVIEGIRAANVSGDDETRNRLLSENEAELRRIGQFADLSGQAVREDRDELQRDRDEDAFQRREKARKSSENVQTAISNIVRDVPDFETARRALREGIANGVWGEISEADARAAMDKLERDLQTEHGITSAQESAAQAAKAQAEIEAANMRRFAESTWKRAQTEIPISERFAFTDASRRTLGDVVKTAQDAGWDKNPGFGDLSERIGLVRDAVLRNAGLSNEESKDADALLEMAVMQQGVEDGGVVTDNLDMERLQRDFQELIGKYKIDQQNRVQLENAREAYLKDMDAADQLPLRKYTAARAAAKLRNEQLRALAQGSTPSVR